MAANGYTYEIRLRDLMTAGFRRVSNAANSFSSRMAQTARNVSQSIGRIPASISQLGTRLNLLRAQRDNAFSTREIRNYNNEIRRTERQMRRLENLPPPTMLERFGQMRRSILGIIGISGGLGLVLAGIGAAGGVIKLGAELEQTRISFQTMMGDVDRGNQMLKDLTAMGAATPFGNRELQENAKLLLNFGIAGEKILPTLRMLGDVSGGNVERLNGLTLAFSQVSSAGKLQGQDLMQMINAGFNPLQQISKMTGISLGKLKDKMSAGGISAKMVELAFKGATSEGGMFHNMMEKQSQTLTGKWSTFTDTFIDKMAQMGESLTPFIGRLIDFGTYALQGLMKLPAWIERNSTLMWSLASIIGVVVGAVLIYNTTVAVAAWYTAWLNRETKLQIFWSKIVTVWLWLKQAATWAASVASGALAVATSRAALATKLHNFWIGIVTVATRAWTIVQWALNVAMNANPIGIIIMLLALLVTAIVHVVNNWDSYVAKWGAGWQIIKAGAQLGWNALKLSFNLMGIGIQTIWLKFKAFGQWIYGFFANIGNAIKLAFNGDFSGAKKALTAPIKTSASEEIEQLEQKKRKLVSENRIESMKLVKEMAGAAQVYLYGPKKTKSKDQEKLEKLATKAEKVQAKTKKPEAPVDVVSQMNQELNGGKGKGYDQTEDGIKEQIKLLKEQKGATKVGSADYIRLTGEINRLQNKIESGKGKAKDKMEAITTGGQKSFVLNVTIGNVMEIGNQYISEGKAAADELVDQVLDGLTRRLNGTFRGLTQS